MNQVKVIDADGFTYVDYVFLSGRIGATVDKASIRRRPTPTKLDGSKWMISMKSFTRKRVVRWCYCLAWFHSPQHERRTPLVG